MSFARFVSTRWGFAGTAVVLGGTGLWTGYLMREDQRMRAEHEARMEFVIEQRVQNALRKQQPPHGQGGGDGDAGGK